MITVVIASVLSAATAHAYTVVVPPTPYAPADVQISPAATAMLDIDSVFMCYQEGLPSSIKFQVINLNTGAIELPPHTVPAVGVSTTCAVVAADTAVIVIRDDASNEGLLFVVNPLTGVVKRGPIVFGHSGTGYEYRVTVSDTSAVFIVWRSDEGQAGFKKFEGRFAIVDPQAGILTVPETTFEPLGVNSVDVATIDRNRVAVAYQRPITGTIAPTSSFVTVRDAHSGQMLGNPIELEPSFGVPRILKVTGDEVLVTYRTTESRFVRVDTATGTVGMPVTYSTGATWDFAVSPAMLGNHAVFIPYWVPDVVPTSASFVVRDLDGPSLVPETPISFGIANISSVASGCRVFLTYPDAHQTWAGMFEILDFSDVCTPPACPPDVTDRVSVFRSPFAPFIFPFLQIQLVVIYNPTEETFKGPLAFAATVQQNGVLFSTTATNCVSGISPFVLVHPGPDDVLSPGEAAAGFVFFLKTSSSSITYVPRLLGGVPQR